jgi:hypothetical protein
MNPHLPRKKANHIFVFLFLCCYGYSTAQKQTSVVLKPVSEPTIIKAKLNLTDKGKLSGAFYITQPQLQEINTDKAHIIVTLPKKIFKKRETITIDKSQISALDSTHPSIDIPITSSGNGKKGGLQGTLTLKLAATQNPPNPQLKPNPTLPIAGSESHCKNCHSKKDSTDCRDCHEIPTVIYTIDGCMPNCRPVCSNKNRPQHAMIVRQNELVALRIKNLNPFRYSYEINNSEVSLNMDDQDAFTNALNNTKLPTSYKDAATTDPPKSDSATQKKIGSIKDLKQALENLKADDFFAITEDIAEIDSSISVVNQQLDSLLKEAQKEKLKKVVDKINEADQRLVKIYSAFDEQVKLLQTQPCVDGDMVNTLLKKAQSDIDSLITVYGPADTLKALLQNSVDSFLVKLSGKDSTEYVKKTNDARTLIEGHYRKAFGDFQKEIAKYRNTSLEIVTLPYQPKAKNIDLVQYDLLVTDNNSNKTNTYTYNVFVRNGFKVDFSTGIFITGLKDRVFTTQDVDSTITTHVDTTVLTSTITKKKILAQNVGKPDFMVGAMLNLTWRTTEMFSVGASFGLGFSTQAKFQVLAGPVFTFGKFYRVSLHTGIALGKVVALDAAYTEYVEKDDKKHTTYTLPSGNPPTTDKFDWSWFAGLTYNFLKPKKDKPVPVQ